MAQSARSCEKPATPTGSLCTEWEVDQGIASRVVYKPERHPVGCTACVHISAIQVEDGSFETAHEAPHIYLDCHPDSGLTIENARALAPILIESAAQLEGWIEIFGAVTNPGANRLSILRCRASASPNCADISAGSSVKRGHCPA